MIRKGRALLVGVVVLVTSAPAPAREACQERTLSLRYSPQAGGAGYGCWAASGQMVMEWLGEEPEVACQCRQAERVRGVKGCCASPRSCAPASDAPGSCDEPRWPAFVERPESYPFDYKTTCDGLPARQDDDGCDSRPIAWRDLAAELCAGRPVLASFRSPGSARGHMLVVKGFSTHPSRRVLLVDPAALCPPGRDCEGELDEGFWLSYEEFAAGWGGRIHWVDFYGIRRGSRPSRSPVSPRRAPRADRGGRYTGS
jgi:hypothetical protein